MEEYRRIQKATALSENLGRTVKSPLLDLKISGERVKQIIREEWRICLPESYKWFSHNNCIPCFKAGKAHWKQVCLRFPEAYEKAKQAEVEIGHTVFKDQSLIELEKIWKNGQIDMFEDQQEDYLPCLCAL